MYTMSRKISIFLTFKPEFSASLKHCGKNTFTAEIRETVINAITYLSPNTVNARINGVLNNIVGILSRQTK